MNTTCIIHEYLCYYLNITHISIHLEIDFQVKENRFDKLISDEGT